MPSKRQAQAGQNHKHDKRKVPDHLARNVQGIRSVANALKFGRIGLEKRFNNSPAPTDRAFFLKGKKQHWF